MDHSMVSLIILSLFCFVASLKCYIQFAIFIWYEIDLFVLFVFIWYDATILHCTTLAALVTMCLWNACTQLRLELVLISYCIASFQIMSNRIIILSYHVIASFSFCTIWYGLSNRIIILSYHMIASFSFCTIWYGSVSLACETQQTWNIYDDISLILLVCFVSLLAYLLACLLVWSAICNIRMVGILNKYVKCFCCLFRLVCMYVCM